MRSLLSRQFQSKCVFASNSTHVLKRVSWEYLSDWHATDLSCFKYECRMGVGTNGFIGRFNMFLYFLFQVQVFGSFRTGLYLPTR